MTNKEEKAILEIIEFEEDWLSLVDVTEEHVKMAFRAIKGVVLDRSFREAVIDRLEKEGTTVDKVREAVMDRLEKEGIIVDKVEVRPLEDEYK